MARATPPEPTADVLAADLGELAPLLPALLARHADLTPAWKHYGAKLGWSLKLLDGRRNVAFVQVRPGALTVAVVLGDRAVDAVAASDLPGWIAAELAAARRYAEGRGVRVPVRAEADLDVVDRLLAIKRA